MWRSHIFWRLFGTFGALLLASNLLLGTLLVSRGRQLLLDQVESRLLTKGLLVREVVRDRPREQLPALQQRLKELFDRTEDRYTLLAHDGRVLADSHEDPSQLDNHYDLPEVVTAAAGGVGLVTRFSLTAGQPFMYHAVKVDGNGPVGFVRVAMPLRQVQQQFANLQRLVGIAVGLIGMTALLLSFWIARQVAWPLQELTRGAERLAAGDYGHKVYPFGRDEVGQLAAAFNHMSERLASQFSQLEEDRHQLRAILGGMVEGVIALDADQRILFANDRAAQLLDFPAPTGVGRRLWEVVRHRPLQQLVVRALSTPEPVREELSWDGPTARYLTAHAARLPGSLPRGAVLVLHDTTELRRLETIRQEFVANVSHELKTPLSVIKACVETLLDGAVEDPVHRGPFLEQVADQAERLHALILDLLSLARIESSSEAFEFEAVPLGPVVQACWERFKPRADAKGQQLHLAPPADSDGASTAVVVWADEEAVGHILDNLVDNAVKYTPNGGQIWLRWRAADGQAWLQVEDNGIGIPEQDLPRIFERFYRVDKARSRALGGTGLGLSIVKHLVQALHGTVSATSQLGRGTTFTVCLPLAANP